MAANIDIFIVPNGTAKMYSTIMQRRDEWNWRISEINNLEPTDEDKLLEVWMVSKEDLDSSNLRDHGFKYNGERATIGSTYMPLKMFEGLREGDVVEATLPITVWHDDHSNEEVLLPVNIHLNQQDYRYRRFGNFEEVMKKVIC